MQCVIEATFATYCSHLSAPERLRRRRRRRPRHCDKLRRQPRRRSRSDATYCVLGRLSRPSDPISCPLWRAVGRTMRAQLCACACACVGVRVRTRRAGERGAMRGRVVGQFGVRMRPSGHAARVVEMSDLRRLRQSTAGAAGASVTVLVKVATRDPIAIARRPIGHQLRAARIKYLPNARRRR